VFAALAAAGLWAGVARADNTVPAEARAEFDKAEVAREEGRLEEAAELYRKAIAAHPLYADAHAAYLATLRGMGDPSRGADLYAQLAVKHADSLDIQVYHAAFDTPENAATALEQFTAANPGHARGWIELTRAHLALGDPKKAEKAVREALKADPENLGARVLLADCYLASAREPLARKELEAVLEQASDNTPARLRLALALHRTKKTDEALALLKRLVSEDGLPRLVAGHWLVAAIQAEAGKYDDAIKAFDTILTIDKGDHDALIMKGQVLLLANRPMDAVKVFEEAAKSREGSALALFCLGWAYEKGADAFDAKEDQRRQRLISAAEAYDRCATLDPTVRPRDSLGFAYLLTQSMHTEAVTQFRRAIDIDAKFAPALNNLGLANDIADNRSEAKKRYDEVLDKIDKENVRALVMLALDHWLDGSAAKARKLLGQALKRRPEDYLAWTFLGDVEFDEKRFAQAIKNYEKATEINDKYFFAWFGMGKAYDEDRKKDEEADRCYKKALECRADPPPELALRLAFVNEKDNLDRLDEALKYYKLYQDLGGDVTSVDYDWIPKRVEEIQKELEKRK
jgi:tetratricopeptide (TPR) repeat protein